MDAAVETASPEYKTVHLGLTKAEIRAMDLYRTESFGRGERDTIPTRPTVVHEALAEYLGKRGHPFPANERRNA